MVFFIIVYSIYTHRNLLDATGSMALHFTASCGALTSIEVVVVVSGRAVREVEGTGVEWILG
jgi:hypothetical protein